MNKECVRIWHDRQIVEAYGEEALSRQHVAKWCLSFQSGRQDVENRNMVREPPSKFFKAQIEEVILNDRRITLNEISSELVRSYGSLQHIVSEVPWYSTTVMLCTLSTVCVVKVLWNGAKDSLEDDARPGQAHCLITPEMIAEVNAFWSWTTAESPWMRSIGYWVLAWAYHTRPIMHQHLNFRKFCAQWVLSLSPPHRYHEEEYGFLSQIVTDDETWGAPF
ncbi:histone-lysine N-methyltransferase SETMAR [Trichonephila clavipes]|nr:histone-lysine N-methyltransferase SETMAR [Trichonephila clavipes]